MKKKIIFSPRSFASKIEPGPVPASKVIPEWFKRIPQENDGLPVAQRNRGTVKRCVPFLDALSAGYMVTLPWELEVKWVNGSQMVFWAAEHTKEKIVVLDDPWRAPGLPAPEGFAENVWRILLPTVAHTPEGYSTLQTHPFNRYDLPFLTLTGVVDSDKSFRGIVANIYIREDFEGIIEKGTPMVQIFPFKRENWVMENGPYDEEEALSHSYEVGSVISRSYQKFFWSKKTYQ